MQQKKNNKIKYFNILITGDNNYNNLKKFNIVMTQILSKIENFVCIGTFGGKYGAEILARLFAQQENKNFKKFDTAIFKYSTRSKQQLYYILLGVAVKWSDLVIIFSNIYTDKIKQIINICKRQNKEYIIIKE